MITHNNPSYYVNEFLNKFEQPYYGSYLFGGYGFENIDGWDEEYITLQNINNCAICFDEDEERVSYTIVSADPLEQFPLAGKLIIKVIGTGEIRIRIDSSTVHTYNIDTEEYENLIYDIDVNEQSLTVDFLGEFCVQGIAVAEPSIPYTVCDNEFEAPLTDISPNGAVYLISWYPNTQDVYLNLTNLSGSPDTIEIVFSDNTIISEIFESINPQNYFLKIVEMIENAIECTIYDEDFPPLSYEGVFKIMIKNIFVRRITVISGSNARNLATINNTNNLNKICCIEIQDYKSEPFIIVEETDKMIIEYTPTNNKKLVKGFTYHLLFDGYLKRLSDEEDNTFIGQKRNYTLKNTHLNMRELKNKTPIPDYLLDILAFAFTCDVKIDGIAYSKGDSPEYDYLDEQTLFADFSIKLRLIE